ncbi:MAG TPA: hypothetical protein VLI69_07495, partial [Gammaproteobacteria bacterium]|nr:hypothetical protein [Gammaproteobacteria bacterium]
MHHPTERASSPPAKATPAASGRAYGGSTAAHLVDAYRGNLIQCPAGLRLEETPRACITMIETEINSEVMWRLAQLRAEILDTAIQQNKEPYVPIEYPI